MQTLLRFALYPLVCLLGFTSNCATALDDAGHQRLVSVQARWAEIQYKTPAAQQPAAFAKLALETTELTRTEPKSAEAWIWQGIVSSSWAGAVGGLGALGKIKDARAALEKALQLDPSALQGSAYTSLAVLYEQAPGWPISFGDAAKAETLLHSALQLNPNGIDSLYFWGDHLYREGRYADAQRALLKAQQAPPRPGRAVADAGRHQDIDELLRDVQKKLH